MPCICCKHMSYTSTANLPSLEDVVPWQVTLPRTLVVCDTVENNGRFLLYTFVKQALAIDEAPRQRQSQEGRRQCHVVWLSCVSTPKLVANGLKKLGCEAATSFGSRARLQIRSIPVEYADNVARNEENDFARAIFQDVVQWVRRDNLETATELPTYWLVLDDVTALAAILGERPTYVLLFQLLALRREFSHLGVLLLSSQDHAFVREKSGETTSYDAAATWFGAGGHDDHHAETYWQDCLVELADGIMDVLPLVTGISHTAHGRIIFSSRNDGWRNDHDNEGCVDEALSLRQTFAMNYCLTDSKALAIRLQQHRGQHR